MKIYGIILFLLFACFLQACQNNSTAGEGGLLGDGYISFDANGIHTIVHDSAAAGDPGEDLLYGNFGNYTLSLGANVSPFSGKTIQFNIAHCLDTGSYIFSIWPGVSEWPGDTEHTDADLINYPMQGEYGTDSLLGGEFHLTRFDTVTGRIAGTFAFTARRFNGVDTIRVRNGVVFDFPITVSRN